MGKIIYADNIVNNELFSTGPASTEARLKKNSNEVCFVTFCPVLLKKSRKIEATNFMNRTIDMLFVANKNCGIHVYNTRQT